MGRIFNEYIKHVKLDNPKRLLTKSAHRRCFGTSWTICLPVRTAVMIATINIMSVLTKIKSITLTPVLVAILANPA